MKISIIFYAVLISFIISNFIFAQESNIPTVKINTSSITQVPADAIYFSVTLSVENADPQKAFEEHKALEKNILEVFKELELPDSNVSYSLLQIGSQPRREGPIYRTRQLVSLKLNDFKKYEPLQLALISKGIYNYSAKFITEGEDKWIEKGVQKTIAKAKKEAEMTARNLGKKIGKVLNVESSYYYPSSSEGISYMTVQSPGESLIELPRFVQLRVSLRVEFELLEK